ncbi:uncharacterized protein MELLADRAFT_105665 [Melampsora larici-populina 98AG31]|uniref:Uncharacterized protein n=1 Tax=Melampsora larici-populina (strain 98AG31 / pathotype 3-4-7) TaxID=747676 RepID=F4RIY9_MELLP|nr:uncharacterized protein MELLADRAFT_105665 [Melampsora larici-populina 98AG31]EGG07644.1 hypothetical protein MELLADRAFT_105665 [Melampsora larici-populina 98AG31]
MPSTFKNRNPLPTQKSKANLPTKQSKASTSTNVSHPKRKRATPAIRKNRREAKLTSAELALDDSDSENKPTSKANLPSKESEASTLTNVSHPKRKRATPAIRKNRREAKLTSAELALDDSDSENKPSGSGSIFTQFLFLSIQFTLSD